MRFRRHWIALIAGPLTLVGVVSVVPAQVAIAAPRAVSDSAGTAVQTVDAGSNETTISATDVDPFQMIGASWTGPGGDASAFVRVRSNGSWRQWTPLDPAADDGADARTVTDPLWVSSADAYEVRPPAEATNVQVHLVRSTQGSAPASTSTSTSSGSFAVASSVPGAPPVFPRSAWDAREPKSISYTVAMMAFIHHTAGTNDYSADDVPSILRGIQAYHMDANGWNDIAYNFLVDRFGRIWEGRGGLDRIVLGGHTGGFNTGSVGVAVLGDFTQVAPSAAAIGAVADIVGWTLGRAGVDPMGTATMTSAGHPNSRYPNPGEVVTLPAVSGHRDVSYTSCPGALYDALGTIRRRAAIRAAQASSPFGSVDAVLPSPGGVRVSGWAIDPSTEEPIDVHVYIGGVGQAMKASLSRPDVAVAFGFGDRHGFSAQIPASPGQVAVCVYGINVGAGGNALVGCRTLTLTDDPVGAVDRFERAPGGVQITGWSLDPDTANSIDVHAYVEGTGVATTAYRSREDLLAWYPDYGAAHGFSVLVPAAAGRRRACAYGINQGAGQTTALRCADIDVAVSPIGSLDVASRRSDDIWIGGWAIDPDTAGTITVHIYANGEFVGALNAGAARSDVGGAYGPYGSAHGFQAAIPLKPGPQRICAYGINVGAGGNALLGCRDV